ncbi:MULTISPECIES: co-chaperone GroES [Parachlamydia]|jgi:chaperonin GroES|uniref:Co-chaperonin GroES n=1 Tax=Parachlamydia acanthamoebae (strain UV7) TaxID=765952 RepID=F8KWS9_PARAV|nr:co-chaperone GroES [Parachlamydia acanthamoebae]EFB41857.1 Co-chaperonin GroES [Parachlamydia acanthamoebae str. Hall's coccus]CCB86260.1 10 kDa chaperonin [Parachlamydia acanthamoebae UV-7]
MAQTEELKATQAKNTLKPLGDRVLVRRLEAEEKLKGGIILPDTAKKKQEQAEVVAIGTGKKDKDGNLIPPPVKIGDIVLMEKYSGQEVTLGDQEYVIVRGDDLIAIIQN